MTSNGEKAPQRRRRKSVTREVVMNAALTCFYERGYNGTSMREIASAAELQVASLYNHFSSKQELLRAVMTRIMQAALHNTRAALLDAEPTPSGQLRALVLSWVQFHALRRVEARVGLADLDNLNPEARQLIVALRDEVESMFRDVITRGIGDGSFSTRFPVEAARGIITMGTSVATWYRTDGAVPVDELAHRYGVLALATVGASDAESP
ncbi:TetR/AcrR family transcriptional regulator [Microbacterium sp. AGC85]